MNRLFLTQDELRQLIKISYRRVIYQTGLFQKRLQGSHFANDDQAKGINELALSGKLDPCLARTFEFAEIPDAHQLMHENN